MIYGFPVGQGPVDSIWKTVARLVKLALADPDRGW